MPDFIAGTRLAERLLGREEDDFIHGNGGRDELFGGPGQDRLDGGADADILDGGGGDDILRGGGGADIFVVAPRLTDEQDSGADVIKDFSEIQVDRIDLRALRTDFRSLDKNGNGRLEHGEANERIAVRHEGADIVLSFKEGSIRIEGVKQLTSGSFLF